MAAKLSTIFWLTKKIVSEVKKIFSFEKTIVCGIGTIVCVMPHTFCS
jgi:hypothetical protein